ncbi:AAA family ATPase [Raoultibacter phocaeensis]|uniref:AAA family ATPase n=1 Tax=Raoultibacter phocaeensis TaxID=2479841 RepID=UPI001118AF17|nr:chromosome partitioning protein ParA [Raoultibacter phocaeensis]
MKPEVVLCVDSESAMKPEMIGLDGENLLAQPWLRLFCSAVEARSYLKQAEDIKEVWVASSDEMEPINLAAALKKDVQDRGVYLLAFDGGGSLKSRASAAGIDAALTQSDFSSKYARTKLDVAHCADEGLLSDASENRVVEARSSDSRRPLDTVPSIEQNPGPALVAPTGKASDVSGCATAALSAQSEPRSDPSAVTAKLAAKKTANLVTVVSACGGAGKSTVAALAAYFYQGFGRRTLLLDADLQFGDMHYITGCEHPLTLDDAASDASRIDRLDADGAEPALLAAPRRLEQSEVLGEGLIAAVDRASSRFDIVVANTSSHWDERLAQLLERSSRVLFIVDQRASSLRASKHALEMCSRCGIATSPFVFAVNRCAKGALFSSFDIACALGGSHAVELKDGGKAVDELLGAGLPLDLIKERNELCLSLERMIVDMMPSGDAVKSTPGVSAKTKRFPFGRRRKGAACL